MDSLNTLISMFLLFVLVGITEGATKNCTANRQLTCYTCMGRDMENCMSGLTCCTGACFKLEDIEHNLIVKGCMNAKEEDASMKVRELNVPLYWANGEKVKGETYFCTGKEFCNGAAGHSTIVAVASLVVATILR